MAPRGNKTGLTRMQKSVVDALIDAKPNESTQVIADRIGVHNSTVWRGLQIKELVQAVEIGRRKKQKIGRMSLEGAKKGLAALNYILGTITDKIEAGQEVTGAELSVLVKLTEQQFGEAAKSAEMGLDIEADSTPQETLRDAESEIEGAINLGIQLSLLPPEVQEEVREEAMDSFRKVGSILQVKIPLCLPPPKDIEVGQVEPLPDPEPLDESWADKPAEALATVPAPLNLEDV